MARAPQQPPDSIDAAVLRAAARSVHRGAWWRAARREGWLRAPGVARGMGILFALACLTVAGGVSLLGPPGVFRGDMTSVGAVQRMGAGAEPTGPSGMENGAMRAKNFSVAVAGAILLTFEASAQTAIEWKTSSGGNGHWYRMRYVAAGMRFDEAQADSVAIGAHLATITSSAENEWVKATVAVPNPTSTVWGPSLGGRKVGGVWTWVTGEPWSFTDWRPGEPTGDGPILEYWRYSELLWNDRADHPQDKWLQEWEADCNGDGVVDYGQILAGELGDENGNFIPDCCEQGVSCVNLVINGGFEAGTPLNACTSETVTSGGSIGSGWLVAAGSVQRVRSDSTCASQGTPKFGNCCVDLLAAGEIRQWIATTPGTTYRLTFRLSGDCASGPSTKRVTVSVGGALQSFDHVCVGSGVQSWKLCSLDFVADSTTTTLSLKAVSGGSGGGPLLDALHVEDVSVDCPADVDGSGTVDAGDIGLVLLEFGDCAP